MSDDSEPRRLRADAARNRQALIDAAQQLFTTRGLSVTLDDIAAEAGVNVATAYRNFRNKHELIDAFLAQRFEQIAEIADQAAALEDPWQGISDFLSRMLHLMAADRGLHDVFGRGANEAWFERIEARIEPVVAGILKRGKKAGVIRRDLETTDLGVVLRMLSTVSDIPSADGAALLDRYVRLALAGLQPSDVGLTGAPPSTAALRAAPSPRP
jgi:AcrR family transcriptional regulator